MLANKLIIVYLIEACYCSATLKNLEVLKGEISGEDFVENFVSIEVPLIMKSSVTSWPLYQALHGADDLLTDLVDVKLFADKFEDSSSKSMVFGDFLTTKNNKSFILKISNLFPVLQKFIYLPAAIVTCKQILGEYMRSGEVEFVGNKSTHDVASLLTPSNRHSLIALVSGEVEVAYPGHSRVILSAGDLIYFPPHSRPTLFLTASTVYVKFSWDANQMFDSSLCDVRTPIYALTHDIDADDDQVYIDYTIPDRVLNTGHRIPPIGLGTARLFEKTFVIIETALKLGYRLFDTARLYSGEERREEFATSSEHEIGRALSDSEVPRSELFLITKVPPRAMTYNRTITSVKESLSQLQTDYLDAVLIHDFYYEENEESDQNFSPWISWRALEELQSRGMVRSIGVSNIKKQDLLRLILSFSRRNVSLVQNWFDPFHQDIEVREVCRQYNITFMGYSTLGAVWNGERGLGYRINPVLSHDTIVRAAFSSDIPASSFVLRWTMEKEVIAIPCSTNLEHLDKNLAVRHLVSIDPTASEWLDGLDGQLGNPENNGWKKSDFDDIIKTSTSGRDEL